MTEPVKKPRRRDSRGRFMAEEPGSLLPIEFRTYGQEAPGRLRAIADDPETPVKLRADIEKFFFESVYGKAAGLTDREDKDGGVQVIRFEGVLEEWSREGGWACLKR